MTSDELAASLALATVPGTDMQFTTAQYYAVSEPRPRTAPARTTPDEPASKHIAPPALLVQQLEARRRTTSTAQRPHRAHVVDMPRQIALESLGGAKEQGTYILRKTGMPGSLELLVAAAQRVQPFVVECDDDDGLWRIRQQPAGQAFATIGDLLAFYAQRREGWETPLVRDVLLGGRTTSLRASSTAREETV